MRDGTVAMTGKAKIRYLAQCVKHGRESDDWAGKQVVVQRPKTKAQRNELGCPFCRSEAAAERAEQAQVAA